MPHPRVRCARRVAPSRGAASGRGSVLTMLHSFLAGTGELADLGVLASLQVGALLTIRPGRAAPRFGGRSRLEVRTPDGDALGYLPPEDGELLASLLDAGASAIVRV